MPLDLIAEFHISIEHHLDESKKIWMETGSKTSPTPGRSAKMALEGMSSDYLEGLQDLHNKISCRSVSARWNMGLTE